MPPRGRGVVPDTGKQASPAALIDIQQAPASILIIKPSSLGDVVHTLPAVAKIRERWPDARLRWLVNPEWAPLLEGNPDLDGVVEFPRRRFRGLRGMMRIGPWAKKLRREESSELILDFQGLLRSGLLARLCRQRDGKVVGLSDAREGAGYFYDVAVPVSADSHAVDRYLTLAHAVVGSAAKEPLKWRLPAGTAPAGGERFDAPFVVLHPFSRGAGKSLTAAQVHEFCAAFAPRRVVIAGRSDTPIGEEPNAINLLNQTDLSSLIYLLRRAAYVVSVDSGPMHIGAALTDRLVSIHTWSDPAKVGPYCQGAWIWKEGALYRMHAQALREPAPDLASVAAFVTRQLAATA